MYVDGRPFVRYNDYHLPLSEEDAGFLEFMRANPGKVRRRLAGLFHESMLDALVSQGRSGATDEDLENAPIKLDTVIMADPARRSAARTSTTFSRPPVRRASRRRANYVN